MSRPEHQAPPEIFYNAEEAAKYADNSRMIDIQSKMTERALELLLLPEDQQCCLLDIGCGSGISGSVLSEHGHFWVGMDISAAMLDVALDRETDGDLALSDMGQGFKFRPGSFDGAVSISALQWLCNCDKRGHEPYKRLRVFFQGLFNCLQKGARAVLQFYPETTKQVEMITSAAMRVGFGGGLVVDFPHSTKAKKHFLVIYAGLIGNIPAQLPKALEGNPEEVREVRKQTNVREKTRRGKKKVGKGTKTWILEKKERQRRQGKEHVRPDSKFTGRNRKARF